jgi:hypothetical protein
MWNKKSNLCLSLLAESRVSHYFSAFPLLIPTIIKYSSKLLLITVGAHYGQVMEEDGKLNWFWIQGII